VKHDIFRQDIVSPDRDVNSGPPEFEVFTTWPRYLVHRFVQQ